MHFGVLHLRGAMGCSVGSYHTNNQAVEVQLMRKVLREQQILSADMPSEADDMLNVLNPHCPGSLLESCFDPYNKTILKLQSLASCNINGNMTFHFYCQILTLNCCHQNVKESLPPLKKKSSKIFTDFCIPMSIFYTFLPFMNTPDVA